MFTISKFLLGKEAETAHVMLKKKRP